MRSFPRSLRVVACVAMLVAGAASSGVGETKARLPLGLKLYPPANPVPGVVQEYSVEIYRHGRSFDTALVKISSDGRLEILSSTEYSVVFDSTNIFSTTVSLQVPPNDSTEIKFELGSETFGIPYRRFFVSTSDSVVLQNWDPRGSYRPDSLVYGKDGRYIRTPARDSANKVKSVRVRGLGDPSNNRRVEPRPRPSKEEHDSLRVIQRQMQLYEAEKTPFTEGERDQYWIGDTLYFRRMGDYTFMRKHIRERRANGRKMGHPVFDDVPDDARFDVTFVLDSEQKLNNASQMIDSLDPQPWGDRYQTRTSYGLLKRMHDLDIEIEFNLRWPGQGRESGSAPEDTVPQPERKRRVGS